MCVACDRCFCCCAFVWKYFGREKNDNNCLKRKLLISYMFIELLCKSNFTLEIMLTVWTSVLKKTTHLERCQTNPVRYGCMSEHNMVLYFEVTIIILQVLYRDLCKLYQLHNRNDLRLCGVHVSCLQAGHLNSSCLNTTHVVGVTIQWQHALFLSPPSLLFSISHSFLFTRCSNSE